MNSTPSPPEWNSPIRTNRLTFEDAIELFTDDLHLRDMRTEQWKHTGSMFDNFRASFKKKYLDQIDAAMLKFAAICARLGWHRAQ